MRSSILFGLVELSPTLAFFIAGQLTTFPRAVIVLMTATTLSCIVAWVYQKRLPFVPVFSALFVLLGGATTLLLQQNDAIIIADTLYYLSLCSILGAALYRKKNFLKFFFQSVFAITSDGWRILTWRWFWFLLFAAVANEVVRLLATPEFWIEYRFYKTFVIILFATYQLTLSRTYRISAESNSWGLRIKKVSTE